MGGFDKVAFTVMKANAEVTWAAGVAAALAVGEREGDRAALLDAVVQNLLEVNKSLIGAVEGLWQKEGKV
jgi:hypothetical protein